MPSQGRLGDKSFVAADGHGCPGCPHPALGPAITGSPNVFVNSLPALRVDDMGIHAACCGPNIWQAVEGSATVFFNGKAAHRMGDKDKHCGGDGKLIEGSANVFVGDSGGGAAKCDCDQGQLMKDAAKSGTPFFEAPMTALEKAKQAAIAKAKQVAQKMLIKAVDKAVDKAVEATTSFIEKGLKGAEEQKSREKDTGLKAKDIGLSAETKEGYTKPTGKKGGKPKGSKSPETGSQKHTHMRENQAAEILAENGYEIEQNPGTLPNGKNPDYKIEGEYFDCLSPKSDKIDQVRKGISRKVRSEQANRIVLNLDDSPFDPNDISDILSRKPIEKLKEVIGIKKGQIIQIFP